MGIPDVAEQWTGVINKVTIGATSNEGGTRTSTVTIGGASALPFLPFAGDLGNDRTGTSTRATTHSCGDEDHI